MKKNQKGFSTVEILVVIVIVGLIAAVGWLVWDRQQKNTPAKTSDATTNQVASQKSDTTSKPALKDFKLDNEGLVLAYNPKTTTVEANPITAENDLYVESAKIKTGNVTLTVVAGIDGIGGGPACANEDRNKCTVLETKKSTFLGNPVTYRLIKTETAEECGSAGVPACDVVPLTTKYILDTSNSTEAYGGCCGTISQKARNTNKKAKYTGSLLISIVPGKELQDKDLFSNQDLLETIKIIESIHY